MTPPKRDSYLCARDAYFWAVLCGRLTAKFSHAAPYSDGPETLTLFIGMEWDRNCGRDPEDSTGLYLQVTVFARSNKAVLPWGGKSEGQKIPPDTRLEGIGIAWMDRTICALGGVNAS